MFNMIAALILFLISLSCAIHNIASDFETYRLFYGLLFGYSTGHWFFELLTSITGFKNNKD